MVRSSRKISKTGIYHVICRGINQQRLFEDTEDYDQYLQILKAAKGQANATVFAYCLMGNHLHLLLEQGDEPLGETMKRISVRYAQWFNRKYQRSGHLFQDRYKSEAVEDDAYFSTVLYYIYQNPVKAGLCKKADNYRWGSRRLLGVENDIIDGSRLESIIPLEDILVGEAAGVELGEGQGKAGRLPRYPDETVAGLMQEKTGAATTAAFLALPLDVQTDCIRQLRAMHISARQLARITGLTRGKIERTARP